MSRADSKVLLASAGTGKTFQLTNRLLGLYASDVGLQRVLASTFTRKAAAEILQRLIERLCQACASEATCERLAEQVGIEIDRANAIEITVNLLRHIDRLRISTLDAWFQERVQRCAFDLGLPADWDVCDPQLERRLSARAFSRALDRPRSSSEWSTLIADLKRGVAESRVHAGLLEGLEQAGRLARECLPQAWEFPPLPPEVPQAEFARALAEFERLEVPKTKVGGPRLNYEKARNVITELARNGDWDKLVDVTLLQRVLDGSLKFDRAEVPAEWADSIRVFVRCCARHTAQLLRSQNLALRSLAADYLEELDAALLHERRLSFDALPRLLARQSPPARLDLDHLLLDEFQDTSSLQWRALESGVDELLERSDASFFCVGDTKQSIYGWRDGNPLLLAQLSERLDLPSASMAKSYRSSAAVLDFVNRIFEDLGANGALADSPSRLAGQRFSKTFEEHSAADKTLDGRVRLWRCPRLVDSDVTVRERARLIRGVELAQEVRAAQPQWSLAFLLRSKKMMPQLLERLAGAGLQASGEGGNPLTDSSAVNAALSLLEFADHPADDYLVLHLATSPLAQHVNLKFPPSDASRSAAALGLQQLWLDLGPAGFLARLQPTVRERYPAFDQRRFAQLLALAQTLQPSEPLRPAQFAERLALERVPDPFASNIQVMTVHAAKGLEFDAVILLDLDGKLTRPDRGGLVARRREGDPRADYDVVTHTRSAAQLPLIPALQDIQDSAKTMRVQEALCVLYVALTRAIHHVELVIDHPGDNLAKSSFAGVLLQSLGVDELPASDCVWDSESTLGTPLWTQVDEAPAARVVAPTIPAVPRLVAAAAPRAARAPSRKDVSAGATLELFQESDASRLRGKLWHAWLEHIDWLEADLPAPAVLERWSMALDTGAAGRAEVLDFLRALAQPQILCDFSRTAVAQRLGAAPSELRLLREQRFAFLGSHEGTPELVQGVIDRAVVSSAQRRAEIVDFKSDALSGADDATLRARAESYRPQLELYREALVRLEGLQSERIQMRLCFVAAGRSVLLA